MVSTGSAWQRWTTWGPGHMVAVLWAFYLGPLVVLWSAHPSWAQAFAPLVFPLLAATGWVLRWGQGVVVLAGASVLLGITRSHLLDLNLDVGLGAMPPGLPPYILGLLFLGAGRAARRIADLRHSGRRTTAAKEEVEQRSAQLALMFRAAAHEIANPLTPLAAQLAALKREAAVASDPSLAEQVARMESCVHRMERLTKDLHDAARGLQGDLPLLPRDTDLAPVLRDLAAGQAVLCREKGLTWVQEIPATLPCRVDPDRVAQAVLNLCQNALRYTETGRIELSARGDGSGVAVVVRDTGIGLPSEQAAKLFRPFARASADERGVGLGLWIVQGIARAHGGTVALESAGAGQGTTATLMLAPQAGAPAAAGATATLANRSTLSPSR